MTPSLTHAPSAIVAATLLFLFWMIPRSIDLTQIYPSANALYVISFFAAGFLLSRYWPMLPGVARVAYALFSSSCIRAALCLPVHTVVLCLHARRTTRFPPESRLDTDEPAYLAYLDT
jgi:cytochrome c oxidase assembly factor CtaG